MNEIDTSQLLTQMRAMAAAAAQGQGQTEPVQTANVSGGFGDLLAKSINSVNELQQESGRLGDAFVSGDPGVTMAEAMIAKQKASVAFEATVQVRNKLLNAYKEIMSMPV